MTDAQASVLILSLTFFALAMVHIVKRARREAQGEPLSAQLKHLVLSTVRSTFTEDGVLVENVMQKCLTDWRRKHLFEHYRLLALSGQRARFCALALEAAHRYAIIEMAYLTREFVSARWPLIHPLPTRMQVLYRTNVSHDSLNPDQSVGMFVHTDSPEERTLRERQEELSTLNEICLPEGKESRLVAIADLSERFVRGEIVFRFRQRTWWERAERAHMEGEAQERPT